jgi:fructose-bisphosphate aldolase class II
MRVSTNELLHAAYGQYALGAFNVCNLEQVHGLFRGATEAHAPVIVQFTRVMRDYAHPLMLEHLLRGAEEIYREVTFAVHHDHGDEASCADAIASGHYSSVMIDASHLPFEQNVAATRRVVQMAHPHGIAVEAELGQLKGVEDEMSVEAKGALLTDPAQAEDFVGRTGCDSLAVAIGTSHGAYKFSGNQRLHLDVLAKLKRRLAGFPLVLHGGSSVPPDEIERIRNAGGEFDSSASGVSEAELSQAIALGVAKVNIATDGRLIWTRVHREFFRDRPGEFDFMHPGRTYMKEFGEFVAKKCRVLGTAAKTLGAPASLPASSDQHHAVRAAGAPSSVESPRIAAKDGGAPGKFPTPTFLLASKGTSRVMTNVLSPKPHLAWFSRGYLPHWDHPGMIQSLSFRLHDSVPREVIERWKAELGLPLGAPTCLPARREKQQQAAKDGGALSPRDQQPAGKDASAPSDPREIELHKRIAKYEDQGHGNCWLRNERIGRLVENALLHFDGQRYRLLAWCVMPNHVHLLVETKEGFPLPELVHSWKSYTASQANIILGRKGDFWQREYRDRFIRDAEHYLAAIRYIEDNPVQAGLVNRADDWLFSSARLKPRRAPSLGAPASVPARTQDHQQAGRDAGSPSSLEVQELTDKDVGAPSP